MTNRVSLAELSSAELRLRPAEAVAIVAEICRQNLARVLPGIPSPAVIRLLRDGGIAIEGPVRASHDDVARAATLLSALLPGFDATPEFRASGALRLLIARALGQLDLPPFQSLEDFTAALSRFTTLDARETAAGLFGAWETAREQPVALEDPLLDAPLFHDRNEERVPAKTHRWGRAVAALVLLCGSAMAGWYWADARMGGEAALPAPTVDARPAAEPAIVQESAPELPKPESMAAPEPVATSLREVQARVIRPAAYSPAFGPGAALYFHEQRGRTSVLKVAHTRADGEITNVASIGDDRGLNFHPRPSPDGSRIAFDSDRDGTRAVYVADADGRRVQRISGAGYAAVPSWSPDGTEVAFVRAEPSTPSVWNVWIAAPDGTKLRRITQHRVGQSWGASWFPDGRRLAYSVETRLVVLNLATGKRETFDSPVPGKLVRTPAVSPDGARIIFQVFREGVWLLDLTTGSMRRVLSDASAEEFTWSPDGDRVAFHSRRNGQWSVWVMAP
jgi:hypothetical protein